MPNVLSEGGFDVMIFPDDHRPAHVHVFKSGLVVINLNNRRTAPSMREIRGRVSRREAREALLLVTAHKKRLVKDWRRIHAKG